MSTEPVATQSADAGQRNDPDVGEPSGLSSPVRSSTVSWAVALAGPFVWFAHFGVVYVLAEAACQFGHLDATVLGLRLLAVLIVAATAVAAAATLAVTAAAVRRWRHHEESSDPALRALGAMLAPLFTLAILAVGLPALALPPC